MRPYRFRMANGLLVVAHGRTAAEALRTVKGKGFTNFDANTRTRPA